MAKPLEFGLELTEEDALCFSPVHGRSRRAAATRAWNVADSSSAGREEATSITIGIWKISADWSCQYPKT